ncbi:MAG: HAMP domain-containing histidine kinase [Bacteroidales bacterium]|nr:HAMP domain-containing histidine kinase [Bacteroidales bacterium]
MKKSHTQLFLLLITLSSLILLASLQIAWIFKTARMQEAQFNHTVDMAMNRIIESLSRQDQLCREVSKCLMKCDSGSCCLVMKDMEQWKDIKKVIENDLQYFGINLDFEFDIVDITSNSAVQNVKGTYLSNTLEKILEQSGYRLLIRFPGKREFLVAQIGYIFVLSIFLLLIISLSILMIYKLYRREKQFSEGVVDFINNMAHELKTPVTNISLAVNMMSKNRKISDDKKLSSYCSIVTAEKSKLSERIDKLLASSFTESGIELKEMVFNPFPVIEETINNYIFQAREKGGNIKLVSEGKEFSLKGDPEQFSIAVGNIIDNSLKYCSNQPEILIHIKSSGDHLIIEISDNGPGIPQEYQKKIFDKYFRIPSGDLQKKEGFGLGLYHSQQIIKKMKGKITVNSMKGNGLKVTIELPLLKI